MSDDLVYDLRYRYLTRLDPLALRAADEIERLEARLAEYETLLAKAGEAFTEGSACIADLQARLAEADERHTRFNRAVGELSTEVVALQDRLAEATRILTAWDQADGIVIDHEARQELKDEAEQIWDDMHAFLRPADSAPPLSEDIIREQRAQWQDRFDSAPACLGRNVKDEPLSRCAEYPKCPCGGPEGWPDSATGEKRE